MLFTHSSAYNRKTDWKVISTAGMCGIVFFILVTIFWKNSDLVRNEFCSVRFQYYSYLHSCNSWVVSFFLFFLIWGDTCSLGMPALRLASQAGPMRNPREGTSVIRDVKFFSRTDCQDDSCQKFWKLSKSVEVTAKILSGHSGLLVSLCAGLLQK